MTPRQKALLFSPSLPGLIAGLGYVALAWVVWDWRRKDTGF